MIRISVPYMKCYTYAEKEMLEFFASFPILEVIASGHIKGIFSAFHPPTKHLRSSGQILKLVWQANRNFASINSCYQEQLYSEIKVSLDRMKLIQFLVYDSSLEFQILASNLSS